MIFFTTLSGSSDNAHVTNPAPGGRERHMVKNKFWQQKALAFGAHPDKPRL